jgi:hypothetical protein
MVLHFYAVSYRINIGGRVWAFRGDKWQEDHLKNSDKKKITLKFIALLLLKLLLKNATTPSSEWEKFVFLC